MNQSILYFLGEPVWLRTDLGVAVDLMKVSVATVLVSPPAIGTTPKKINQSLFFDLLLIKLHCYIYNLTSGDELVDVMMYLREY